MNRIKTKSFDIAVYAQGDNNADKLAIVIPGRLDTKDYANFTSHVDCLSKQGFFALAFDPPGTWESSGGIELYTTTNYLKAIREIIDFYGNRPTLLVGHSRGGSVAILASEFDNVSGVVVIMGNFAAPTPPTQEAMQSGFQLSFRDLPPGITKTTEQKEFKLPISYFMDGGKYNPESVLKKYVKPKLIIYSSKDEFTAPEIVRNIYENIPDPKMIVEVESEHDYRYDHSVIEQVNKAIIKFVDQYLHKDTEDADDDFLEDFTPNKEDLHLQYILDQFDRDLKFIEVSKVFTIDPDQFIYEVKTDQGIHYLYELEYIESFQALENTLSETIGSYTEFIKSKNPPRTFEETSPYRRANYYQIPEDFPFFAQYVIDDGKYFFWFLLKK